MPGFVSCHNSPDSAFNNNVRATVNILNLSVKYGVKKILIASSMGVENFRHNPSIYGLTKVICEMYGNTYSKIKNNGVGNYFHSKWIGKYAKGLSRIGVMKFLRKIYAINMVDALISQLEEHVYPGGWPLKASQLRFSFGLHRFHVTILWCKCQDGVAIVKIHLEVLTQI